ncbi:hypothetical protein PHPALM_32049 [Phytophthora palmivora]|uniref:Uncharacterized protein n=1 Tax=Phytophthora palmivora TaxID=4796 RepID=A0A2P4X131_9STRA|nr:hypothetical protein PHPALM_32049 [Phytophthora palmivora]
MAIVNGFIVHKLKMQKEGKRVPTHAEYMCRLHVELLAVTAASLSNNKLAEDLVSIPIPPAEHHLEKQERLYRENRLCSAFTPPKVKGFESRFFAWYVKSCTTDTSPSATAYAEKKPATD